MLLQIAVDGKHKNSVIELKKVNLKKKELNKVASNKDK